MTQNITQFSATASYSDNTTGSVTLTANWQTSDTGIASVNSSGVVTINAGGKIWGGDIGITASVGSAFGTGTILVISSDSGSVFPKMPQQDNHWQLLGLSPWGAYGGCQELTGNLVLSGSAGYTLTANAGSGAGIQYGQSITGGGWTRLGIQFSGTTNQRVVAASGTGPNLAKSFAILGYMHIGPSTANLSFFGILHATAASRRIFTSDSAQASNGSIFPLTNINLPFITPTVQNTHSDRVHPYLIVHNVTTSKTLWATDIGLYLSGGALDVITVDSEKGFGALSGLSCASGTCTYIATATGSIAEYYSDPTNAGTLLQSLSWSVPWKAVPTDSSSIKLPFLPTHWTSLGYNAWTATWNCQDKRANLFTLDVWEGKTVLGFQLVASNSPTYSRIIPNWNRKAVNISETNGMRFNQSVASQQLFDPTGSFAMAVVYVPSASLLAANSTVFGLGTNAGGAQATRFTFEIDTAGKPKLYCAGATTTGSTSITTDGNAVMSMIVYDKTNSRAKLYTPFEKLTGSFNALGLVANLTASFGVGGALNTTVPSGGSYMWIAICTGSTAENFSDDGKASKFYKDLGWTSITW